MTDILPGDNKESQEKGDSPNQTDAPKHIVGIGASAGGLDALLTFFNHMPKDSGLAFVIIQHLSPDHKSLMGELLAKRTEMEILEVRDGMEAKADHVYLIPPKKNLTVFNRKLLLASLSHHRGLNLPIDVFFRSLAEDQEEKAIGIILSGTGSDGTRGIMAIKKAGGLVIVQDEKSAQFDGMPKSAINTGVVDFVCIPEQMPEIILNYITHPFIGEKRKHYETISTQETDLTKVIALLRSRTSVDFTYYKTSTVVRRIERRMGIVQAATVKEYLDYLVDHPEELDSLYKDLLIGVTRFFRDKEEFEFLKNRIVPGIFENNKKEKTIRVWVVGCASGEEAFTIAILLQNYMDSLYEKETGQKALIEASPEDLSQAGNLQRENPKNLDANLRKPGERGYSRKYEVKVFATDIDKNAIEKASLGHYPDGIATDLPDDLLERYFIKTDEGYKVRRHIRELVIFASQNVLRDPPFTKLDLITCRNLLIYLQPNLQKDVMAIFHFSLKDKGYLFLGTSETVGDLSGHFIPVDRKIKIFQHQGVGAPPIKDSLRLAQPQVYRPKSTQGNLNQTMVNIKTSRQLEIQERYYQDLINQLTECAVIVNADGTLVETFGKPDRFLKQKPGKVNLDITKMVGTELSLALGTGLRNAVKEKKMIQYDDIPVYGEETMRLTSLKIIPLQGLEGRKALDVYETGKTGNKEKQTGHEGETRPNQYEQLYRMGTEEDEIPSGQSRKTVYAVSQSQKLMVVFHSKEKRKKKQHETTPVIPFSREKDQHLLDLEKEIQYTRENLQTTIEELQTANEELQATNEELLASNEELQSTNEELNSVNEELNTVNAEYQSKITELTELNNDMDNLLRSTEIGTIFLDINLHIRKFTPAVVKEINLLRQDIGRPLTDLSSPVLNSIKEDVYHVLRNVEKVEKTIQGEGERYYLAQMLPYLDEHRNCGGVVISLVNITLQKKAEKALKEQFDVMKQVLETSPAATIMVDGKGRITFANKAFQNTLQMDIQDLKDQLFDSATLCFTNLNGDALDGENRLITRIKTDRKPVEKYLVRFARTSEDEIIFSINANPTFNQQHEVDGAVLTFTEIAHRKPEKTKEQKITT